MIRALIPVAVLTLTASAQAQVAPTPSMDDPRLQTVEYLAGAPIRLVAFPDSSLMLVFHRGEAIERVELSDSSAFRAAVVGNGDTIQLSPTHAGAIAQLHVMTDAHEYQFNLETGEGLAAAFGVRLVDAAGANLPASASQPAPGTKTWTYRVRGNRAIQPDEIKDDGERTFLEWDKNRALPAVFGGGPAGGEELVAGYMRNDVFVIDRVYPELVFRFDKETATATRVTRQE